MFTGKFQPENDQWERRIFTGLRHHLNSCAWNGRKFLLEELGSRIEIKYVLKPNLPFSVLSAYSCIVKLVINVSLAFFIAVKAEKELNCEDPSFINALEIENKTLQERIAACKSNIMMVTSFDKRTTQVWISWRH